MPARGDFLDKLRQLALGDACLCLFAREVHLNEDRQTIAILFRAQAIKAAGEGCRIQRVNQIKEIDGATRFVRLKVTDQMPAGGRASKLCDLLLCFLHAVLA